LSQPATAQTEDRTACKDYTTEDMGCERQAWDDRSPCVAAEVDDPLARLWEVLSFLALQREFVVGLTAGAVKG
jgi:hypothetical protein